MMYDFIIYDGSKEVPLFSRNWEQLPNNPIEIKINPPNNRKAKYTDLICKVFNTYGCNYYSSYTSRFSSIDFTEGVIIYNNDFLAIKTDKGIEILFVRTLQNIYVSKNIKSYKNLWNKIKVKITEILDGNEDVILTKDCGKNIFLQFEKPKFKSIQEREDYCNSLVEEVLPTKPPIVEKVVSVVDFFEDTELKY